MLGNQELDKKANRVVLLSAEHLHLLVNGAANENRFIGFVGFFLLGSLFTHEPSKSQLGYAVNRIIELFFSKTSASSGLPSCASEASLACRIYPPISWRVLDDSSKGNAVELRI